MNLNVVALITTACLTAALGLVAFLRAPDRPVNRIFGVHAFAVTLWVVVTCSIERTHDIGHLTALLRLVHMTSTFAMATFVDFMWVFPNRLTFPPRRMRTVNYIAGVFFFLVAAHPALIRNVTLSDRGLMNVQFGWPLALFALYGVGMVTYVNVLLWRKLRVLQGVARVQTIYVLASTLAAELIIFTTNAVLPIVTGRTDYSRWGVVGYQLIIIAIAISIAKYRLWEVGGIGRRLAATSLATATLAIPVVGVVIFFGGALGLDRPVDAHRAIVTGLIGLVLGLAFPPLCKMYSDLVSRSAEEEQARIGQLFNALGAAAVHTTVGGAVLQPMLEETREFFGAGFVEAYLHGTAKGFYNGGLAKAPDWRRETSLYEPLPPEVVATFDAEHLSEPLETSLLSRFGSVERSTQILAAMHDVDASVVMPLRWHDETIGLLLLGPKLSRGIYGSLDIEVLGSVAAHAAIALKNTELRAQILAEKERTEKVLAQMESGVVALDASKTIRLVNTAACSLLGRDEHELLGAGADVLPRSLLEPLQRALDAGTLVSGERAYLALRGPRVACSTFLLRGPEGGCEGAGVVFRDLRTEDALQRSEREKERLQFIRAVSAGMAHEIRNPLVAIRTFAELAPSRLDDPEFRDSFIQVAQSEIGRLEDLVSHFMTLAKPPRVVSEPIDLRRLADGVAQAVSARAHAQGIRVRIDIPDDIPSPHGDEPRLYQALMNLLLNALDAAPDGGRVSVRATLERGSVELGKLVALSVWNSGSYIAPEERERVFEPFFTSKATGTGLGLAICHTIVDEHGGTMTIESDPDTGTAFVIRLAVAESPQMAMVNAT